MPAARHHEEIIELMEKIFRLPAPFNQASALSSLDAALYGILIETLEYFFEFWVEIDSMKEILCRWSEPYCVPGFIEASIHRTDL